MLFFNYLRAYGDNRILFSDNSTTVDLSDYIEHSIWSLTSASLSMNVKNDREPFEDTTNSEVVLKIEITRKSLYYMMNSVFPCFLLNLVTLATFFMIPTAASSIGK